MRVSTMSGPPTQACSGTSISTLWIVTPSDIRRSSWPHFDPASRAVPFVGSACSADAPSHLSPSSPRCSPAVGYRLSLSSTTARTGWVASPTSPSPDDEVADLTTVFAELPLGTYPPRAMLSHGFWGNSGRYPFAPLLCGNVAGSLTLLMVSELLLCK